MHCHRADVPHGGVTGVAAGVPQSGVLDQEEGGRHLPLLRDLTDAAPDGGVGDGLLVVVPEDVLGRLGAVLDQAGEVHGGALLQEDVGTAHNLREGFCNQYSETLVTQLRGRSVTENLNMDFKGPSY